MKILVIGSVLICSVSFSNAQLVVEKVPDKAIVGKVNQGGLFLAELSYRIYEKDTTYMLMYKNQEYSSIVDLQYITFGGEGGAIPALYKIFKSVFAEENKKNKEFKVQFKLGDNQVIVANYRVMGFTGAMFSPPKGFVVFTEKQIDRLFGKID